MIRRLRVWKVSVHLGQTAMLFASAMPTASRLAIRLCAGRSSFPTRSYPMLQTGERYVDPTDDDLFGLLRLTSNRTALQSVVSTTSRRKSRKPSQHEEMPYSQAWNEHSRKDSAGSLGRRSIQDRPPTPPGPGGIGGAHRRKPSTDVPADQPVPRVPSRLSGGSTFMQTSGRSEDNSRSPGLMPPMSPIPSAARRVSNAPSSYAGSLYDMYIGGKRRRMFTLTLLFVICTDARWPLSCR